MALSVSGGARCSRWWPEAGARGGGGTRFCGCEWPGDRDGLFPLTFSLMTEGADLLSLQARGLGRKGRPGLRLWAVSRVLGPQAFHVAITFSLSRERVHPHRCHRHPHSRPRGSLSGTRPLAKSFKCKVSFNPTGQRSSCLFCR